MSVRLTWNTRDFEAALHEAANQAAQAMAMVGADSAARSMGRKHGGVASAPGSPPNVQTSHLRNSIGFTKGENGRARFGTGVAYGRHLEFGARIRPRTAKHIVIPLNREARRMLVQHRSPRAAIEAMKGGTGRKQGTRRMVTKPVRSGGYVIGLQTKSGRGGFKGSGFTGYFLLKKYAIIPARPWLRPTVLRARAEMKAAAIEAARRVMVASARRTAPVGVTA